MIRGGLLTWNAGGYRDSCSFSSDQSETPRTCARRTCRQPTIPTSSELHFKRTGSCFCVEGVLHATQQYVWARGCVQASCTMAMDAISRNEIPRAPRTSQNSSLALVTLTFINESHQGLVSTASMQLCSSMLTGILAWASGLSLRQAPISRQHDAQHPFTSYLIRKKVDEAV